MNQPPPVEIRGIQMICTVTQPVSELVIRGCNNFVRIEADVYSVKVYGVQNQVVVAQNANVPNVLLQGVDNHVQKEGNAPEIQVYGTQHPEQVLGRVQVQSAVPHRGVPPAPDLRQLPHYREQVANLPIHSYAQNIHKKDALQECTICMEEFRRTDQVKMLPCLHYYHIPCIDQWLASHPDCPICKTSIANLPQAFMPASKFDT